MSALAPPAPLLVIEDPSHDLADFQGVDPGSPVAVAAKPSILCRRAVAGVRIGGLRAHRLETPLPCGDVPRRQIHPAVEGIGGFDLRAAQQPLAVRQQDGDTDGKDAPAQRPIATSRSTVFSPASSKPSS